jgi:hypothetical protein
VVSGGEPCYEAEMLHSDEIHRIALNAALAHIPPGHVRRVMVEPYINSVDEVGLKVTIVLPDEDEFGVDGETVGETLLAIHDDLDAAGETRIPSVWYTTEKQMAETGDPDI